MARTPDPAHTEELLDEALDESFPASDPPSIARSGDVREPAPDERRPGNKPKDPDKSGRR